MISGFVQKAALFSALALMGCGGKDSSGPEAIPTSLNVANGAAQTAIAGSVVAPALTFSVKDQNGNSLAGVPVTITVTAGGGTITGSPTTTSSGETSIGTFTLGTLVGVNTVTIKAGNLAPVTFSITTVAGPPTQISAVSGGGQSAPAGTAISGIVIKVADQFGNGVAGRPVTIQVIDGGGAVSLASGTTDASGQLSGITWTLGKSALPQRLSIASGAIANTVSATVATAYSLEVRYFGGDPTPEVRTAFDNSAARIRGAITGSLPSVVFTNRDLSGSQSCGVPAVLNETVPGVVIFAQVHPIDGPGKVLGAAGPCLIRSTSRLTVIGVMEFDEVDLAGLVASKRLEDVILHEMLHVVGFGTLWDQKTPSLLVGAGGPDSRFIGATAIQACSEAGGTTLCAGGVAVENCVGLSNCGGGTRDSHWREGTTTLPGFRTELMTGFVSGAGIPNPFSNMSVQSLGDLGYVVNANASDPYTVPSPTLRALFQLDGSSDPSQWERVRFPIATVTRTGTIQPLERQ